MKTTTLRYKAAKSIVKAQNSAFAESFRNYLENHERLHVGICGTLSAIAGVLAVCLIVGQL